MPRIRRVKRGRPTAFPPTPYSPRLPPEPGTPVTFDVYRAGREPPDPPDAKGVGVLQELLTADPGVRVGTTGASHLLVTALGADVRDGPEVGTGGDWVHVPDAGGDVFRVYALARRAGRRWCYLRREQRPEGPAAAY